MPFQILPTIVKPLKEVRASISYRRPFTKKPKGSGDPKLIIGIPMTVLAGFKPKATEAYALMAGTGADKGRARIVIAKAGGVVPRMLKGGGSLSLRLRSLARLGCRGKGIRRGQVDRGRLRDRAAAVVQAVLT